MNRVGVGTRTLNFLIDTFIVFIISFIVHYIWKFYSFYWHVTYFPFYYFFWLILVLYYLFCESIWAKTPGKYFTLSKVVDARGKKPAFWRILIRSFSRLIIIDPFFLPFLNKTLHDYLSGTEVVEK